MFWKRKKHKPVLKEKVFIPLSQVGDDTLVAMVDERDNVSDRLLNMSTQHGSVTMHFGSDGLWQAMVGDNEKVYSGHTKRQALDAIEKDLG